MVVESRDILIPFVLLKLIQFTEIILTKNVKNGKYNKEELRENLTI